MNYKKYFLALATVVVIVLIGRWRLNDNSSQPADVSSTSSSGDFSSSSSSSSPYSSSPSAPSTQPTETWKDGSYTGQTANAYYGDVQVKVTVSNGKITNVSFLNYPQDNGTSRRINSYAVPQLQSEVIKAQSTSVNAVSGASFTSQAFTTSLQSALDQAR